MSTLETRRRIFLESFLEAADEGDLDPYAAELASINHVRLMLGRDLEKANHYFETVEFDPRPVTWKDGKVDTADWDFLGVKLLKTVLDFQRSPQLSDYARNRLKALIIHWRQPRPSINQDNNKRARWPTIHTENHDIMCLTIGLFSEWFAGRETSPHVGQLCRSLCWRFERGWVEWNSPCYQVHYLNPLLILRRHAPHPALRKGAEKLINLQLAERALLSVNGYLGGPFYRGYDRHIADDRFDGYLPIMWLAFGLAEGPGSPGWRQGMEFAADTFEPEPVISTLAEAARSRPELNYEGVRHPERLIRYYNTPHVSMGSMQVSDYSFQTRYFNVLFADEPGKSLRTFLRDRVIHSPWDKRNERGEVAQYGNWLLARGTLVEEGGISARELNGFNLYRVGKGLCAHNALPDDLHVFQVSDLDRHADEREFANAIHIPRFKEGRVRGGTLDRIPLSVNPADMSLFVKGEPSYRTKDMLHDCKAMTSSYGSGEIEIRTPKGALVLNHADLLARLRGAGSGDRKIL